jgi:hypothetical protein
MKINMVSRHILSSCRNMPFFAIVGLGSGSCMHEASTEDEVNNPLVSQEIAAPVKAKTEGSGKAKFDLNNTDDTRIGNENAGDDIKPGNK